MAKTRFYKTFFIPSLHGQFKLWKTELVPIVNQVDEIIQMGNLIGCNPLAKDSPTRGPNAAILEYITLWRSTFTNWTQLVGPNEILALNFPDEWTNQSSNKLLRKRWLEDEYGRFQVATVSKERLVTHGGLTYGLWVELGRPETASEAADALNEKYCKTLYQGPSYALGDTPNFSANPIFAHALYEVYPSWLTATETMPFSQVHSSPGLNTENGRSALKADFSLLKFAKDIRYTVFGSQIELESGNFFLNVSPELPFDKRVNRFEAPWRLYVEKTPVLDLRDELFE